VDEGQPSAGKSVKDRGAVVLVWSSSAPDTSYVSSDRRRRRAASLISPQPRRVHRLGRRHAVAYNCHCAIVFLSSSTTAQCATMFATTSPANTRQSSNRQQSRLLLRSTGRCLQSPPESTSVRHQRRCPTRLLGEAIRTHHAATPRSSLVAGARAYTVSPLCSDVPLSERHISVLPRREHLSGS